MKFPKSLSVLFLGLFVIVAGCAETGEYDAGEAGDTDTTMTGMQDEMAQDNMGEFDKGVAVIHSEDTDISGWVTFTKQSGGVQVNAELSGLTEGKHGFHIHQYGDCRDVTTSPGGHYNPTNEEHGMPSDSVRHMGDMGNITANAEGTATMQYMDDVIKLNKIMGRAVIVHKGEDTFGQPTGSAGNQIACGVIGIANSDFSPEGMQGESEGNM